MTDYKNEFCMHDATCGELRKSDVGREVTLCGWAWHNRDHGGLIFCDLRDRTGYTQVVVDPDCVSEEDFHKAEHLGREFVLQITGKVRDRGADAVNPNMATGEIEVLANKVNVLNESVTPPFSIEDGIETDETTRMKWRYMDLRRPEMYNALHLRHTVAQAMRAALNERGFIEVETPILANSTPEGARDYLVPSRVHPGRFYALPQSPQIYKQLLMLSGFDRYIQIARCFRDEDLRADRQPDFTQIDLEMSFVERDDVIAVNEGLLQRLWKELLGVDIPTPFRRMTYREAMDRYGSDKPDLRFGLELVDLSDTLRGCGFKVFASALEEGGSVRAINVKGGAQKLSRKEIDSLGEYVKTYRAKGLAWARLGEQTTSSFAKFLSEQEFAAVLSAAGAQEGDVVLIVADAKPAVVFDSLGALRCEVARRLGLIDEGKWEFLWVTDFPLLEYDEEQGRYVAMHHPFTAPMDEDLPKLDSDPGSVRAKAYDCVLNGYEIGGGSIRIYNTELQSKMFDLLGLSKEQTQRRFGFLLEAFDYGTPPHGGLAFGLDRLVMLLAGEDNIRNVIAFPKVQNASELMSGAPDTVDDSQLEELSIKVWDYKDK